MSLKTCVTGDTSCSDASELNISGDYQTIYISPKDMSIAKIYNFNVEAKFDGSIIGTFGPYQYKVECLSNIVSTPALPKMEIQVPYSFDSL